MLRWYTLLAILFSLLTYQSSIQAISGEPITITRVDLVDHTGASALPTIGTQATIQVVLENNQAVEQNFVYIVQIKDSNGFTIHLSWTTVTLMPLASKTAISQPWEVNSAGSYTVEVFVWKDVTNPVPLSYGDNSFVVSSFGRSPEEECKGSSACFQGRVTKIVDGDTIDVDERRIRLALVNTPERGQAGYEEAKEFTKSLCPVGLKVLVDQDDLQLYDRYDRMIAVVYCDGALLNAELLFADHAKILTKYCKDSEFSDEEWAQLFGC